MAKTVTSDTFNPPCHEILIPVQNSLKLLLEEYDLQFTQDETSIGTTPLTSMSIDTGTTDPVSQKPYPIAMKHYDWVKSESEKLLAARVIHSSHSSWSAPIIAVLKGDGGKCLVIDYRGSQQGYQEIYMAHAQSRGNIFQTKWSYVFHNFGSLHRIPLHPSGQVIYTQNCL